MCFGSAGAGNPATVGLANLTTAMLTGYRNPGGLFGKIGGAGGSTPASAVMANPAIPKVAATAAIQRRPDEVRVNLGAAPATPQQTLRATLGGA